MGLRVSKEGAEIQERYHELEQTITEATRIHGKLKCNENTDDKLMKTTKDLIEKRNRIKKIPNKTNCRAGRTK